MVVGCALNHGPCTYRLYNPKRNRIIISRDVKWMDFTHKQLESEFDLFSPGVESINTKYQLSSGENVIDDDTSIFTHESIESLDYVENTIVPKPKNQKEKSKVRRRKRY